MGAMSELHRQTIERAELVRDGAHEMLGALKEIRSELQDEISGYEEDRGRDQWLSRLIEIAERAILHAGERW